MQSFVDEGDRNRIYSGIASRREGVKKLEVGIVNVQRKDES